MLTKKISVFFILLLSFTSCGTMQRTSMPASERAYEYIEIHNKSKDYAFSRAMDWIAINYNSANSVIQFQDKENGKIVIQAEINVPIMGSNQRTAKYTLQIWLKDNKAKIKFTLGELTRGYLGYPPTGSMPGIRRDFLSIKNGIINHINNEENW